MLSKKRAVGLGLAEEYREEFPQNSFWGPGRKGIRTTALGEALGYVVHEERPRDAWPGEPGTLWITKRILGSIDYAEPLGRGYRLDIVAEEEGRGGWFGVIIDADNRETGQTARLASIELVRAEARTIVGSTKADL